MFSCWDGQVVSASRELVEGKEGVLLMSGLLISLYLVHRIYSVGEPSSSETGANSMELPGPLYRNGSTPVANEMRLFNGIGASRHVTGNGKRACSCVVRAALHVTVDKA